jgi:hypothetical protein
MKVMRHLTSVELVDLAEGTRAESSAPHLVTCEACRHQLAQLRAAMSTAEAFEVREPSPLFWDHLSARVHEAVAAEGRPRGQSWSGWASRFTIPMAAGVLAALVLAALVTMRTSLAPESGGPVLEPPTAIVRTTEPLAEDASLALVADLAAGLDWDGATDAGLTMVGGADGAIKQLNAGERRELDRLLKEALAKPGA